MRLSILALLLLSLLATTAPAQEIGVFADSLGTEREIHISPYVLFPIHIVVRDAGPEIAALSGVGHTRTYISLE